MNKTVAILGGGHGAHSMAADLISRGFTVNIYEMPEFKDNLKQLFETRTIVSTGEVAGRFEVAKVTSDIDDALDGVRHILIVTPAFAHAGYAKLLKGKVNRDQVIILYPGAFSAFLFRDSLGAEDCPVIAEANNLPYDARVTGDCQVAIYGLNSLNIGFMPAEKGPELIDELRNIHPFGRVYEDVVEAGLSIINPAIHSGPCLMSISAIENWPKRPFFLYEHGITPATCRLDLRLDQERKEIGRKLGYNLTPIEDFSGLDEGYTWQELYMFIHGNISLTPITGPHDINSRYLTEDAPFGLVPWSHIGKMVGVETPVIDSVVNIYNVVHERDWWEEGRSAADLGLAGLSVQEIKEYARTGVRPR